MLAKLFHIYWTFSPVYLSRNEQVDVLKNKKEHFLNSSKLLYQVEEAISELRHSEVRYCSDFPLADLRVLNMSNPFSSVLSENLCSKCSHTWLTVWTTNNFRCKEILGTGILHKFEVHAFIMIFKTTSLASSLWHFKIHTCSPVASIASWLIATN